MKRFAPLLASLIALASASAVHARPFEVPADHAALIRLPGDAAAIVVGNPHIADVMLYDARTIFVTGRVYGRTNLIALDDNGRVLYTSDLAVTASPRGQVQVFRNNQRMSYVCAPECQAVPLVGDEANWFDELARQQADRVTAGSAGN
ncbi:MAG: pilus assembly protein N-terminal domain-containing protein [Oceanicaulis sp.]|uniref:pilus assembly protein N-terminal domain-containing protein n=1 Tax=Glycocaulis sp. TaxID=1969725 RepID=UPI0025BEA933|nr:pilus assembly protein N-terminal domain-containing protein [Glycocaulis sp.]MCC5982558.1 pilus assembly protein N-terminal domain-containing protein [Oceanicaulis sp.]MCH8522687.1 pilus assembly protein N-terminal domain-containing protein [Glycocaulis sp.]